MQDTRYKIQDDEGQHRPKYIFNKCGTNIYFFYTTEVWSITITKFLKVLIILINLHGFQCKQIHAIELQECQKILFHFFCRTDIHKHLLSQRVIFP